MRSKFFYNPVLSEGHFKCEKCSQVHLKDLSKSSWLEIIAFNYKLLLKVTNFRSSIYGTKRIPYGTGIEQKPESNKYMYMLDVK